jgi:type II secretory pathway predicted ATPase ExeA
MYCKHFGLARRPFGNDIPTEAMYVSKSMTELDVRLRHLIDLRGIGLITGDPGAGKSAACRKLVSALHPGLFKIMYVPLSTGNAMDVYKTISWELGIQAERNRAALYRDIKAEVSRLCFDAKIQPVLIIDEAHHLRSEVIEELRLLTNYDMDSQNRLCLILCGHTEIRRRIGMAVHEALNQRIVVRYQMGALERNEIAEYLAHLLRFAGTELPLFESSAIEAIFQASKGLPRKINLLAHHTLLATAIAKERVASEEHVHRALLEVT